MGQLVFQATLGGQVNLVGPNTAATLNINVPAVDGNMVTTGDTGTVTNVMMDASAYAIPGAIGSTTPNTGAFTTLTASGEIVFDATSAMQIPNGTTAERPGTPLTAQFRYNSDYARAELYNGSAWTGLGGATGGGGDAIFYENGQVVTADYTITTDYNAGSFGPITINDGITVTIPSGSVWTVV